MNACRVVMQINDYSSDESRGSILDGIILMSHMRVMRGQSGVTGGSALVPGWILTPLSSSVS